MNNPLFHKENKLRSFSSYSSHWDFNSMTPRECLSFKAINTMANTLMLKISKSG